MSHVQHINESRCTNEYQSWVKPVYLSNQTNLIYVNVLYHTYGWAMSHISVPALSGAGISMESESPHTYEWVMSNTQKSHVTSKDTNLERRQYIYEVGLTSHTSMYRVTHMNEPCHTYEWAMSHISEPVLSGVSTSMKSDSLHTYEPVTSHVQMSHVTPTDTNVERSQYTYEVGLTLLLCMYHIKHINEPYHTYVYQSWAELVYMNVSCHTYEWAMLHISIQASSVVSIYECITSHIWMRHFTQKPTSVEWSYYTWMYNVTHMNAPCHTYAYQMSEVSICMQSDSPQAYEYTHTYELPSHICLPAQWSECMYAVGLTSHVHSYVMWVRVRHDIFLRESCILLYMCDVHVLYVWCKCAQIYHVALMHTHLYVWLVCVGIYHVAHTHESYHTWQTQRRVEPMSWPQ